MSFPAFARVSLLLATAAGSSLVAILAWVAGPAGAGASPAVALVGPTDPILPGDTFAVTVEGAGLPPLGAYEVVVSFDAVYLEFIAGSDGGFLGSTGRSVACFPPVITATTARFGCATTGSGAGPEGAGTLATLYFKALVPGRSDLALREVGLADVFGDNAGTADVRNTTITVEQPGSGDPKPTETATPTPGPATPEGTSTVAFVPRVETPTVGAGTAIPTATNTRTPNTPTPATNASATAAPAAATNTPPSGAIAGDPSATSSATTSSGVQGSSRIPAGATGGVTAGVALPSTGSAGLRDPGAPRP